MSKLCALCRERPANKSGAHVIPYFLIKSMLLPEGKKRGDAKEFSFEIGELNTDFFVGRNVFGEDLERLVGRFIDPDELKLKKDPYTVDNIWCQDCENLFGHLEDYYSRHLTFEGNKEGPVFNKCAASVATLFWCSIVWRIGITNFGGSQIIKAEDIEALRELIFTQRGEIENLNGRNFTSLLDAVMESGYCHQLLVCPTEEDISAVVVDPVAYNPLVLVVNGRIVLFYPKGKHALTEGVSSLFNTLDAISKSVINPNGDSKEVATRLGKRYSDFLAKEIFLVMAKTWSDDTKWLGDQLFNHFFDIPIPDHLLQAIKHEINFGTQELSIPERYSKERIHRIIASYTDQFLKEIANKNW